MRTKNSKEYLMHKVKIISLALIVVVLVASLVIYLQPEKSIVKTIPEVEYSDDPVPDFNEYESVTKKKQAFFDYLKPAINAQNEHILSVRQLVQGLRAKQVAGQALTERQTEELNFLIAEYRVDDSQGFEGIYAELLSKIDIIPAELVLVQSANESAWGTSRFATKGYNFFGLWCFKKGCGFVPKRRDEDASHEVAKFNNLSAAMYSYMRNINRHPAYKDLRIIRQKSRENQQSITAYALAEGLTRYSERGEEYVEELRQMIRVNKELMES